MVLCATSSCIRKKKPHFKHTDIYLAGSTYIESSSPKTISGSSVATYWKNGVPTILTDTVKGSRANGITVIGKDVYVVGDISIPLPNGRDRTAIAACWKNGVLTKFGRGTIYGVAAKGKDIYMVGTLYGLGNEKITFWKNGLPDTLGDGRILSITVDAGNIYMAGYQIIHGETNGPENRWEVATYWKNGKPIELDNNVTFIKTMANSIFIQDGDAYIPGSHLENAVVPMYWKNRDSISLSPKSPRLYGEANGIYADENNVYQSGYVYVPTHNGLATFGAVYWKNGIINYLPYIGKESFASAIVIQNNDTYVAGSDDYPIYWKNGKRIQLGKNKGQVSAITVVGY
jgi:hypothetical protein